MFTAMTIRRMEMLYTYNDCIKKYGSDYQLKKALSDQKLYKVEKGIYSSEKYASDLAVVSLKYPNAVFTDESAYYYHGLTDVIPDHFFLATRRKDSRIRDKRVIQSFISNEVFEYGITDMSYNNTVIRIYSRERMLIELMRFRSRYSRDYYKEILLNYRRIIYDLDFWKVEEYAALFANGDNIMKIIETEVL